jgi:hypothetical protein
MVSEIGENMPCERRDNMVICSRGKRKPVKCHFCNSDSTLLCDWHMPNGKTCDKPLCRRHARFAGKDIDYCKDHPEV